MALVTSQISDTRRVTTRPDLPASPPPAFRSSFHVTQDINVLALIKGEERYIFLYDDAHRAETLRTFGRYASNPELSFSWYDAAVLSQRLRQETQQSQPSHSVPRFTIPAPMDSDESL
jgi:hypothetical protein